MTPPPALGRGPDCLGRCESIRGWPRRRSPRPKNKIDPRNTVVGEDHANITLRKMRRKLRDVSPCAALVNFAGFQGDTVV